MMFRSIEKILQDTELGTESGTTGTRTCTYVRVQWGYKSYIRGTREMGMILRPGASGIRVHLFVDASYGVHVDGRSHTGSCVVIGDLEAVHCRSSKQQIVTKSSTEAEVVALSDSANQGLFLRNFLTLQGYDMLSVIVHQDNLSCMALLARGRSGGERTHINIRYFWLKDRVDRGEATIVRKGTEELYTNVLTKPLQGLGLPNRLVPQRGKSVQPEGDCGGVGSQGCSLGVILLV
jgi:hypothetical protein